MYIRKNITLIDKVFQNNYKKCTHNDKTTMLKVGQEKYFKCASFHFNVRNVKYYNYILFVFPRNQFKNVNIKK